MLLSGYFISLIKRLNLHCFREEGLWKKISVHFPGRGADEKPWQHCGGGTSTLISDIAPNVGPAPTLGGFVWPLSETRAAQHKDRERAF